MITAASNSLFLPRGDVSTLKSDNPADQSANFFSLLLALFPHGVPSSIIHIQASDPSSKDFESRGDFLSEAELLLPSNGNTEKGVENSSSSSRETLSFDQSLLLSFLAFLLQGQGQLNVNTVEGSQDSQSLTPLKRQGSSPINLLQEGMQVWPDLIAPQSVLQTAMQALRQELQGDSLLQETTAENVGLPRVDAELATMIPESGKKGTSFSSQLFPTPSFLEGNSANVFAGRDKNQQSTGLVPALSQQASNLKVTGDSMIIGSHPAFGEGIERKPTETSALPLESLGQSEQSTTSMAENAFSQAKTDLLVQKAEGSQPSAQTEQLLSDVLSRGKNHETSQDRLSLSSGAEVFAVNSARGNATVALPLRRDGTVHAANLESWQQVVDQVSGGIISNVQQDKREARLQLTPPELGKLDIQLIVENGHIRAHIMAESTDVSTLIQSHLPELKQALQTHHLDLRTVLVDVQTGGGEPNTFFQQSRQEWRTRNPGRAFSVAADVKADSEPIRRISTLGSHSGRVSVWA